VTGTCIDCGQVSELILSPRFPHICSRCLFPPTPAEEPRADAPEDMRLGLALSLAERLEGMRGNGVFRGNLDAIGKSLPESYNRGKRE
jgi:hypothetical protein